MKKILKILLTMIFLVVLIFAINKLIRNFLNSSLLFVVLAFILFAMHLVAWIIPRTFFNLCWKITGIMPDNFDYDTSYGKLELVDMGVLITSILLLGISLLFK
ncbi:MAG: hypothetical protein IJB21_07230 [Bacilli bacterium]|nr:hypothetical protein [Bacilli bacterium]